MLAGTLAGCGSSADQRNEAGAAAALERLFQRLSDRDAAGVCAGMSDRMLKEMTDALGGCEVVLEAGLALSPPDDLAATGRAKVRRATVYGNTATIADTDIELPAGVDPDFVEINNQPTTLIFEDGQWKLDAS